MDHNQSGIFFTSELVIKLHWTRKRFTDCFHLLYFCRFVCLVPNKELNTVLISKFNKIFWYFCSFERCSSHKSQAFFKIHWNWLVKTTKNWKAIVFFFFYYVCFWKEQLVDFVWLNHNSNLRGKLGIHTSIIIFRMLKDIPFQRNVSICVGYCTLYRVPLYYLTVAPSACRSMILLLLSFQ